MSSTNPATTSNGLIIGADAFVAEWVARRVNCPGVERAEDLGRIAAAVGVCVNDRLAAGWVYHAPNEVYSSVQVSVAAESRMWAKRHIIAALLDIAFSRYNRVYGLVMTSNKLCLRTAKHIGFVTEGVARDCFGHGVNGVCIRMVKAEYMKLRKTWNV